MARPDKPTALILALAAMLTLWIPTLASPVAAQSAHVQPTAVTFTALA